MNTTVIALYQGTHVRGEAWVMNIGGRLVSIVLDNNTVAAIPNRENDCFNPIWAPVLVELRRNYPKN